MPEIKRKPTLVRKRAIKRKPSLEKNRELISKALTDPAFRKLLETDPAKALNKSKLTSTNSAEIKDVLSTLKQIDTKINALADKLLCANGGPCGIA
jgi:hypothetical protein